VTQSTPDDTAIDVRALLMQSAELAKSNKALSDRITTLSDSLKLKAEQREFKRTKNEARWSLALNVLHIAAFAVAFLFGLGYVHATDATSALASCVARADAAQQANTDQLREAATKERTALRTLVDAIANPMATQEAKREAFLAYQTGLHAADVQRDPSNLKPVVKCAPQ
jgi:hypothetical protein